MTDHGFDGMTLAVLLVAVTLAVLSALRWDALLLWLKSFFEPPAEEEFSLAQIARMQRFQAPRHLHDSDLQHQAVHRRPEFHRSGRRG